MTLLPMLLAVSLSGAAPDAANPCTNGSFEELNPAGFPLDWDPVGKTVGVSTDAHSGKRSLRLARAAGTPPREETGLNRGYNARLQRPALIDRLRGGIDFWYKAISAADANLQIYVIPMGQDNVENTGAQRAKYTVPKEHVGDGQWHHARLKYDFTKNPKARWVHFAARIEGTGGELLLDDFSYVDKVGPLLRFGKIRLEEDPEKPGERCTLVAPIENAGDEPAKNVLLTLTLPAGLTATPKEIRLGEIALDRKVPVRWTLEGRRIGDCEIDWPEVEPGRSDSGDHSAKPDRPPVGEPSVRIAATAGAAQAESVLPIAPHVVLKNWGATSPVFFLGQPVTIDCVLVNVGNAIAANPKVLFARGDPGIACGPLAPGQSVTVRKNLPVARSGMDYFVLFGPRHPDLPDDALDVKSMFILDFVDPTAYPKPSGSLQAVAKGGFAFIENEHVRLAFVLDHDLAELSVRTTSGWERVAWLPQLMAVRVREKDGKIEYGDFKEAWFQPSRQLPPKAEVTPDGTARLRFQRAPQGEKFRVSVTFELQRGAKTIAVRYELTPDKPDALASFVGPSLQVLDRDEAVFPGMEWLVGNELSSDSLDIAAGHADRIRAVVHPIWVTIPAMAVHGRHGTVGLLWDARQKWDGTRDRPGAYFVSPDQTHNYRSHQMSLFLPNPPEFVKANAWDIKSEKAYRLEPGKPLRLEALIYADGEAKDALAAIDEWVRQFGIAQPKRLPRGTYEQEIEFSMQAYLKSLWVPEEQKWWTTKGGGMMSQMDRPRDFVADLLVGELLSPDPEVRQQCRARAEEVLKLIGGEPRLDAQRHPGRVDMLWGNAAHAANLLSSRGSDGAWRFDADQEGQGPFVGADYHELGPNNAAEVGTCARRAFEILRYARITGDRAAYQQMLKTLEFMEQFRVPRAAQVWEVPVHTPDILAAADAVDAYIEAYRFSGDPRWLRDAVTWARRGLPFVYLWDDPQKPFLLGASIPVFGATWMQGSWFGRPVQWNGLRYAQSIWKLGQYDKSYPWRQISVMLTRSAIHQQDTAGENVALWPDNIGAVNSDKCPWVFSPRMILANVLQILGRDEEPATVIVGQGASRLHITTAAKIADAAWDGKTCSLGVTYPRGQQGTLVIFNVAKPAAVFLDGKPLAPREDVEKGSGPGWRYEASMACLSIRVARDGLSRVRVEGAAWRSIQRLPQLAERIAFEFGESLQGWQAFHQVSDLTVRDGAMVGHIDGGDPYIGRSLLRGRGDDCSAIVLRMRVTAGHGGQLYWATAASPVFVEERVVNFPIRADGQWHEYRLELGKHPQWAGQTITAIRLDPGNGAQSGEFAVEYLRAVK